ncbi:hypothetical protein AKJ57_05630 [candidate division MSBL1 archaeon SCGC-AAA259A05]|uniref:Hydrogenase formation protein HypD n=1 Tax=candidate division MSBL1 archaeon SCGC-AAA259A05 TaxID=1698259 RepID=A0A133U4W8_9EURY|nr:hypothetical protein AKJ57_05630 [candidate division MSBL1 archaeon SCGC-AAA259A05]
MRKLARGEDLTIMHISGGHELSISKQGIRSVLPPEINIVGGLCCTACVTPTHHIQEAIEISEKEDVTLATFGDMIGVPGNSKHLARDTKSVRVVNSMAEALDMAKKQDREVVFFGIGFEATAATYAPILLEEPDSFSFLGSVKRIPPFIEFLLRSGEVDVDGLLAPGLPSTITGPGPYQQLAEKYNIPIIIAGIEPLDILYAITVFLKFLRAGSKPRALNAYPGAVKREGNKKAIEMMDRAFESNDACWRGIGTISDSGLRVKEDKLNARGKFEVKVQREEAETLTTGFCNEILWGRSKPDMCEYFRDGECTPHDPRGPWMAGWKGICSIWYRYHISSPVRV